MCQVMGKSTFSGPSVNNGCKIQNPIILSLHFSFTEHFVSGFYGQNQTYIHVKLNKLQLRASDYKELLNINNPPQMTKLIGGRQVMLWDFSIALSGP